ncbi:MAG: hypothetical protein HWQ41_00295 [Nostoc sp. NOS(2021)]|uniref:alginate O-acetyltransferase AlgX-related protein n=1 Tax=Nostoc sp. NOS(2021) TaxID=2815407 RepID=UPI0025FC8C11|nr:hypothetical protein [Nostoc sp. NOS(2021)]MBN3893788.1 hypothetical protein [Nostoc sp. NOS(2021)]
MAELMLKLKSGVQRLLLIFIGIVMGLLIIETFAVFTGVVVPQNFKARHKFYYEFLRPDPQLGLKVSPNLRNFENLWNGEPGIEKVINTDNYGFRNLGRDYSQSNLYFIGDSFVWGLWVNRDKTFYGIIESEIKQPVIALGVPAYGFEQYEILFQDWVTKFKPKTAVLCVYANDLNRLKPLSKMKDYYEIYGWSKHQSLPWYKKTFLYQFIFNRKPKPDKNSLFAGLTKIKNGLFLLSDRKLLKPEFGLDINYLTSDAHLQVEEALTRIIDLTQLNQVKLFIFLIPSKESTYIKDYAEISPHEVKYVETEEIGYNRLCQLAKSKNVNCVDLTKVFRQHSEEEKLYFDIDDHWNVAGHKLASQLILDTLIQEKGVDLTQYVTNVSFKE